jgi:predicted transcriptional regulator
MAVRQEFEKGSVIKMSKSVYSLVLSDEVVAQIDRLAYRSGISRSAMIDSLLAKEVAYITPEMRIRQIMEELEKGLFGRGEAVFLPVQTSGASFGARSSLAYKYNPSLRYFVELYREVEKDGAVGELRVSLRSRSENLVLMMLNFFKLWQAEEKKYLPNVQYYLEDGKFTRRLLPPLDQPISASVLGQAISRYVQLLNQAIGDYFSHLEKPTEALRMVADDCRQYYAEEGIKI